MPRIRTIKPEFWADEKLGPLPPLTRLVFLGLWSMADDKGRLVDSTKQIDAFIFPYTEETSRGSIVELSAIGRIRRGTTAAGQSIIQIVNWHHQKIEKPNLKAALPEIAHEVTALSPTHPRLVADQSPTDRGTVPTTYDQLPTTTIKDLTLVPSSNGHAAPKKLAPKKPGARVSPKKTKPDGYSPLFEQAWKICPKRSGDAKFACWSQWQKRVAEGFDESVLLAATERYAAKVARDNDDPQFFKGAAVFYGPKRHFEADFSPVPWEPGEEAAYRNASPEKRRLVDQVGSLIANDAAEEERGRLLDEQRKVR